MSRFEYKKKQLSAILLLKCSKIMQTLMLYIKWKEKKCAGMIVVKNECFFFVCCKIYYFIFIFNLRFLLFARINDSMNNIIQKYFVK